MSQSGMKDGPMRIETQTKYRHKQRGTEYTVTNLAHAQCARPIREGDVVVVYVGRDGNAWVRPVDEFGDGRFEKVGS